MCSIAPRLDCPFLRGDRLTEVNGTNLISNAMLAPSLILGACDTSVHLRMIRPHGYVVVEGSLRRRYYDEDKDILVMKGGNKACGIGVVLEIDPCNGLYFVKRVIEDGPAWGAGVRKYDTILSVDGKMLKGLRKEALPSLIVGPAGSVLSVSLVPAGGVAIADAKHISITRLLDTARAQYCNAPTAVRCVLSENCIETITFDVPAFFEAVRFDLVQVCSCVCIHIHLYVCACNHPVQMFLCVCMCDALLLAKAVHKVKSFFPCIYTLIQVYMRAQALVTSMERVVLPQQEFDGHSMLICFTPAAAGGGSPDERAVEELVAALMLQISDPDSALKYSVAGTHRHRTMQHTETTCNKLQQRRAEALCCGYAAMPVGVAATCCNASFPKHYVAGT